jgi:hypothetical protein
MNWREAAPFEASYSIQLSYGRVEGGLYRLYTSRLGSMDLVPESEGVFYRKPIKINKMVGQEGLERQRSTAFDLPIMRRWERAASQL